MGNGSLPRPPSGLWANFQGVLNMMALLFFISSSPPGKLVKLRNTPWENSLCPEFWKPKLTSWGWRGTTRCGLSLALLSPSLWKLANQPFRTSMGKKQSRASGFGRHIVSVTAHPYPGTSLKESQPWPRGPEPRAAAGHGTRRAFCICATPLGK